MVLDARERQQIRKEVEEIVRGILDREVWPNLLQVLNDVENGILTFKESMKKLKIKTEWDPKKICWEKTEGAKGPYERSKDLQNPEFKLMMEDLQAHNGKLSRQGYFYWLFDLGPTMVGRKKQ